jgi:ribosome modulation factor
VTTARERRDEIRARVDEAVRRGGCAFAEGTPAHLNPYRDHDLREAWLTGWTQRFLATPARRIA